MLGLAILALITGLVIMAGLKIQRDTDPYQLLKKSRWDDIWLQTQSADDVHDFLLHAYQGGSLSDRMRWDFVSFVILHRPDGVYYSFIEVFEIGLEHPWVLHYLWAITDERYILPPEHFGEVDANDFIPRKEGTTK